MKAPATSATTDEGTVAAIPYIPAVEPLSVILPASKSAITSWRSVINSSDASAEGMVDVKWTPGGFWRADKCQPRFDIWSLIS